MGCCTCRGCLRVFLVVLNIFVGLLGLALTVLGAIGVASETLVRKGVSVVVQSIPGISDTFGVQAGAGTDKDAAEGLVQFLQKAAIPILIIGIIITVISISGMCGAGFNNKCLLITYAIFLLLILAAQVVLIILYCTPSMKGRIGQYLKVSIEEEYVSIESTEPLSLAWTVLMLKFNCCGAHNYTDFNEAKRWERDRQFDFGPGPVNVTLVTPLACCKMTGQFPEVEPIEPETCATAPTELTSNYKIGCYDEVKKEVKKYDVIVIAIVAAIIAVQAILIIFTIVIIHYVGHDDNKVV